MEILPDLLALRLGIARVEDRSSRVSQVHGSLSHVLRRMAQIVTAPELSFPGHHLSTFLSISLAKSPFLHHAGLPLSLPRPPRNRLPARSFPTTSEPLPLGRRESIARGPVRPRSHRTDRAETRARAHGLQPGLFTSSPERRPAIAARPEPVATLPLLAMKRTSAASLPRWASA